MPATVHPRGVRTTQTPRTLPEASPLIFNSINIIQPVGEVPTTEARGPTVEVIEEDQTLQRVIEVTRRNSNNDSTKFRAGQLASFQKQWSKMGAPEPILKLIRGYRIPFFEKPPLAHPIVIKSHLHTPVSKEMSAIILKMKAQGILEVAAQMTPSFISPLFLVPKTDGTFRPIFNLKALNQYIKTEPFYLISMARIPDFLQSQDWMCKIDLSQAYFHLKVAESHRRFLRLVYDQEILEMTCLPFGLSTAPKTFAILTNWVAQILRERWNMRVLVYLDDYLIVSQDRSQLQNQVKITVQVLQYLGWLVNFEKSILQPQKSLVYLGVLWRPWDNLKSLPLEKTTVIKEKVKYALEQRKLTLKEMQSLTGLFNFASFVVPRGRLNYRQLLMFMIAQPDYPCVTQYQLPEAIIAELNWWSHNCNLSTPLHYPPPVNFIATDASDLAWGAQLNDLAISGAWSHAEAKLHCNQKEMLAILYALQRHADSLKQTSILVQCDNRTAVAQLRKEGGTKSISLMKITHQILNLVDRYQIHLSVQHIPGRYNSQADHLSRNRRPPEWHLLPACVEMVFSKWGTPVIDLFASETAHVVHNYVSRDLKDQQAMFHNAFSTPWNYQLAWVFPPPFLIPKVLAHLNQSTGIYLVVVPRWEKVFWRADLRARALTAPLTLKNLRKHLVDTSTGLPPPQIDNITLEVWKCGGGPRR